MSLVPSEIVNMALSALGSDLSVVNFDKDTSNEAKCARVFYGQAVREVLEDFPWPFACVQEKLALAEWFYSALWLGKTALGAIEPFRKGQFLLDTGEGPREILPIPLVPPDRKKPWHLSLSLDIYYTKFTTDKSDPRALKAMFTISDGTSDIGAPR